MLSVSTAWNYKPGISMKDMLTQIKNLGVEAVELGYKLTEADLKEIFPLLKTLNMHVSSVHNFCPLPSDEPSPRHPSNYYRLSAIDEPERRKAVEWTNRAVDTAVQANCKVVVIHAGTIELPEDPTTILKKYKIGETDSTEFSQLRDQMLKNRALRRGPYLKAVIQSLKEVVAYARPHNVLIGLETRYYPTEIPNFEEIGEILKLFTPEEMGFWHDIGHGEVNVRLGIVKQHADYFNAYGDRLIGLHIHGVQGIKDHQAPLSGDFDLQPFWPIFRRDIIKVIESHAYATPQAMEAAVKVLKSV